MSQSLVKLISNFSTTLVSKTSVGATSLTLTSATDTDGVAIPTGTYGFTIDRKNSKKEFFTATLTGTALTSIQTVAMGTGLGTSGLLRTHRKGAEILITDFVAIKRMLRVLDGTTDLDSGTVLKYDGVATITPGSNQLATVAYADGLAIAGAADATTTTKGIVEEAIQSEVDAGTAAGGTSARLFINPSTHRARQYNDYAVDSVGTDAYAITITPAITAYAAGQVFVWKAGTANTGGATLNVSALGAKTILKENDKALVTGDIESGQVVECVYDGTNMQMVSPSARTFQDQNSTTTYSADAGANDTYAILMTPTLTAYVTGQVFSFKANTANTGPATLNIDSLGAIAIKKNKSLALETGDIVSGQIVEVVYDGTNFQMQSQMAAQALASAARGVATNSISALLLTDGVAVALPIVSESFDVLGELDMVEQAITMTVGTGTTTIVANAAIFSASDVGRWVFNATRSLYTQITVFNSSTNVTCSPAVAAQATTDTGTVYSGRFVAGVTGKYQVNVAFCYTGSASCAPHLLLKVNGSTVATIYNHESATSLSQNMVISDLVSLTAGDTLQAFILTTGAAITPNTTNDGCTYLSIKRVS